MAFGLRYGQTSPFNTHVTKLAEALCDGFRVRFVRKMPQGAIALCDLEKCEILLPALDPSKLNAVEGQKVYGYSAHERKHAKLSSEKVFRTLSDIVKEAKENKKTRSILPTLVQIIEDCRIEMNKNYSMPGDMEDIAFFRAIFCEEIVYNELYKANNPIGYIVNCFQYQLLSTHDAFIGLGTLPSVPTGNPTWQEMYNRAMTILEDGRFKESLKHGKNKCQSTLDIALDIEAAWNEFLKEDPQPCPKKNQLLIGELGETVEDDSDPEKLYDDVSELFDAMNEKEEMIVDAFSSAMDSLMEEHGILDRDKPSDDVDPCSSKSSFNCDTPYVGFNIHDRIIVADPAEGIYNAVCAQIGPQINHVRDTLAVYLKSLTRSHSLRHLRNGRLDQRLFYKTAKGIENKYVFKQTTRGEDFSVAVSLVIDLSGSMGCASGWSGGSLSPSGLSMQMTILLAEVFNLLEIPFEIVGFNTDNTPSYDRYGYNSRKDLGYRHSEFINYWIFKSFDDHYMAGDTRFRLGSITGSGCNVDHEVVYWSAGRLWRRNTQRKLQVVLSDGYPSGFGGNYNGLLDRELIRVNKEIVAAGIEQFAFGLQSDCVKKYYKDYLVLNNLADLNMEALRMFADYLLQGRNK